MNKIQEIMEKAGFMEDPLSWSEVDRFQRETWHELLAFGRYEGARAALATIDACPITKEPSNTALVVGIADTSRRRNTARWPKRQSPAC